MSILNVEHLSHGFGDRAIFGDVSFRLLKGEHIGLLGANGEGKSTFLNIVTGKLQPDEGKIEWAKNVRVGYLDQHTVLEKGMTIQDVLKSAFAYLFELEEKMNTICDSLGDADEEEMMTLMEELGTIQDTLTLHDFYVIDAKVEEVARALGLLDIGLEKDVTDLSGGQRTKVLLAKLLLEKPDILLLDEPINGLDPQGIVEVRDTILRLNEERNMTILVSSHILEELSKIATHYGIIHNGSLLQEMTKEELMKRCSERIEICLDEPKRAVPVLDEMGFTNYQIVDKERIHIFERLEESAGLNMGLAKAGILVREIRITSEELEDYFLNLTGGASHV